MAGFPVQQVLRPVAGTGPTLFVVIDTEEEFDWDAPFDPASTDVANIACQPLAQALFDAHGIVPTYVVDYPVATSPAASALLKGFLDDGRCDIGAHLHPWVNPPAEETVSTLHSYACNLPAGLMQRKLAMLTDAIEAAFGRKPVVYKAGRYGAAAETPDALRQLGYRADASVVPHTDFGSDGGPDFRGMPEQPFFAADGVLAVPLSVHFVGKAAAAGPALFPWLERARRWRLPGIASRLGLLERLRLSPEGHAFDDMVRQTRAALARGQHYFALTYHSSSLMPGGSPYSRTKHDRDVLLDTLRQYLHFFVGLPSAKTTTIRAFADMLLRGDDHSRFAYAPHR